MKIPCCQVDVFTDSSFRDNPTPHNPRAGKTGQAEGRRGLRPTKARLPLLIMGLLCFSIHFLLIFHHVYVDASHRGSRISPYRHLEFPRPWHAWLDLNRWDAGHYENIIVRGYRSDAAPGTPRATIQWYPGYPLLAGTLSALTGAQPTLIFSVLSAAFTLAFWLVLWSAPLSAHFGKKAILIVSLLILCWPAAFLWFAGMTEPLVALLLLIMLYLWITRRPLWVFALLALATFTKQPFVPAALVIVLLDRLGHGRGVLFSLGLLLLSISGFIAFGAYGLFSFGDFFASSNMASREFRIVVTPLSLIDLSNYARHINTLNGAVAVGSTLFLFAWGLRLADLKQAEPYLAALFSRKPVMVSSELFLWSVAVAFTAFAVLGTAYNHTRPFMSMLRYETANIYLFFLAARLLQNISGWKLAIMLVPLAWLGLFWQNLLTVNYWLWKWVS